MTQFPGSYLIKRTHPIRCSWPFLALTALALLVDTSMLWAADGDFTAPFLSITSHANGQIVNTKTIVLSGTATDAGRGGNGISGVYVGGANTGATAVGNGTVNWSESITLSPGANTLNVYAYDNSTQQNVTTVPITINFQPVDSLPPTLVVTSHQNGQTVNTKTITVSGTATDAGRGNNGISSVYLNGTIAGATATGAGTATWSQTVTLYPGANYISVYAYDNSDVQNAQTLALVINFQPVDALPPTIVITSHTNGQIVATSTIQLEGTATDAGRGDSGISSVYVQGTLPNVNAAGAGTVAWSKSVSLYPGSNYIAVYAYDNSDVQNEASLTLTIVFQPGDVLPPNLTINGYTNGATVFTSTITLSGTASDAGRGDNGISSVYLNGTLPNVNTAGNGTVTWSKSIALSPGANNITVYAYDNNQFPNMASQTITINFQPADTLGPNLAVTSPADGQTVNSQSITIIGTASDAGRGDDGISSVYCQGKIDGATSAGATTVNWSQQVNLTPGRNMIFISASDNSPFPNTTSLTLTLNFQPADSLPPSLNVTSHTDGQIVFTNVITVAGTASDAGRGDNGVSSVKVNFQTADGGTAVGAGVAHWSRTFALNPGPNNIYVSAADASEFLWETNVTFNVIYQIGDLNPPLLTIDAPRNNQTFTTSTITVSGSATDAGQGGNGVAQVTVNGVQATGGTATGSATATWNRTVNLLPGANVISVVAVDNSNNQNSAAQTVIVTYDPVDSTPPVITIDSHKNSQTVATSSILLAGTATDLGQGGSGISSVTVNGTPANGDTAAGSATANWSQTVALIPGPNVISVVARDNSPKQNAAAQSITIIYDPTDTTPPALAVTSHRKGQTVSTATIVLAGTATDAGLGGNGIADVSVNSQPATGGTASGAAVALWSRTLTLNLGPNALSIVARDNSPNKNSAALSITIIYEPVDRTPPDLAVTSHKDGQTVLSSSITLEGTATDADRGDNGVASVTVNGLAAKGGTAVGAAQSNWSQPITLNLGANVISIVAQDTLNNSVAKTITLTYDPHALSAPEEFCWVNSSGGPGTDAGYAIAVDAAGNSYVTGSFEGSATFATTNLISLGLSDVFVAKYDRSGSLLWVRQAGGTNADAGFGIAVDAQSNCYVTGYFSGNADFSGTSLKTTGTFDLFLAKYDLDGTLVWATTTGTSSALFGSAVVLDATGNCYLTGSFSQKAVFGDSVFQNNSAYDAFAAKYDTNGAVVWARQLGGDGTDQGTGIAVDSSGQCYVTGFFEGAASFGDQDLISVGDRDMFICQFDSAGTLQWIQQGGAVGKTQGSAIAVDRHGNSLVTGYYDNLALFGTNIVSTVGFYDLFLAKYDPQGNLVWVQNTTSSAINGTSVATDADGNGYVTGSFIGPASFGNLALTNSAVSELFLAKYDGDGNFIWARQSGGQAECSGFGVAVDSAGTCYLTGSINGIASFGSKLLTRSQKSDTVVAKLLSSTAASPALLTIQRLAGSQFQIQFTGDACANYRLQGSADLIQWTTLTTASAPTAPVVYLEDSVPGRNYRFFRVVSP
jgi:Glucodextranase, domain B/Beta-propeller repeat